MNKMIKDTLSVRKEKASPGTTDSTRREYARKMLATDGPLQAFIEHQRPPWGEVELYKNEIHLGAREISLRTDRATRR